jgi:O-methyltransferase
MKDDTPLVDAYLDLMKKAITASLYDESGWTVVDMPPPPRSLLRHPLVYARQWLRHMVVKSLAKHAIVPIRRQPFDAATREIGRDWPLFGYSMIGHKRMDNVRHCVEDVLRNRVPGDFIETGAWRGGTTIFMRALLKAHNVTDRKVWVADSFEGLPKPKDVADGWDLSDVDYLKVSLETVKANFAKFGLLDDQVAFLKGWFCDTLPTAPVERIAILRLDGDMYSSTMDALRNLYDKVSQGGYVIVDDYSTWPSCKAAVTDFLAERGISAELMKIDDDGMFWQKR